jgi:hypothetical protein
MVKASILRSRRLQLAVLAAGVVLISAFAFVAATRLGSQGDQGIWQEGLLITANRDRLRLCVQAVPRDPAAEGRAVSLIQSALAELKARHPLWRSAGLKEAQPVVEPGCPSDPALLHPGAEPIVGDPYTSRVTEPSKYRVFVFILPQAEIDRLFARWPLRQAIQESICQGHVCSEVTSGLYLSTEEIENRQFLYDALAKTIGLEVWVP